jgi:hypothetical protein
MYTSGWSSVIQEDVATTRSMEVHGLFDTELVNAPD